MNRADQWCIILCHDYFEGMELYYVAKLVKVITKILDTTYLPINNPLIKSSNKTEVPLEGEEEAHHLLVETLWIIWAKSMHKTEKLITTTIMCLITYQNHILSNKTQHASIGVGMSFIREKHQDTIMIGIGCPDLVKNISESSLTSICWFLTKFYIDTILLPHKYNIIKVCPLYFGEWLWLILLWILITFHPGYNRMYIFWHFS